MGSRHVADDHIPIHRDKKRWSREQSATRVTCKLAVAFLLEPSCRQQRVDLLGPRTPSPRCRLGTLLPCGGLGSAADDGVFDAAAGLDANAITWVQARIRRRLLRVFVRRGLLPRDDARAIGQWAHGGGFSVDGSVRIEAADRAGRERLLDYCARPPFALDRLRELGRERLLYEVTKPGPGGGGSLLLNPLELIDRIAALVPPPRVHRHRYFGAPVRTAANGKFPQRPRTAAVGLFC